MQAAEEPFDAGGKKFNRGSFIVRDVSRADLRHAQQRTGTTGDGARRGTERENASAARGARGVPAHLAGTQTEGWWRQALDNMHIPYDYISTQTVAKTTI